MRKKGISRHFTKEHGGTTAIEYALLCELLALVGLAAVSVTGANLQTVYNTIGSGLTSAAAASASPGSGASGSSGTSGTGSGTSGSSGTGSGTSGTGTSGSGSSGSSGSSSSSPPITDSNGGVVPGSGVTSTCEEGDSGYSYTCTDVFETSGGLTVHEDLTEANETADMMQISDTKGDASDIYVPALGPNGQAALFDAGLTIEAVDYSPTTNFIAAINLTSADSAAAQAEMSAYCSANSGTYTAPTASVENAKCELPTTDNILTNIAATF